MASRVPRYPSPGNAIHSDSRIRYHGPSYEDCEAHRADLAMLYEAYGKAGGGDLVAQRCPYCRRYVVLRIPRTVATARQRV